MAVGSVEWVINEVKTREDRLRRMAKRQGIVITKTRRIDRRAKDYGTWTLDDPDRGVELTGLSTDEVETYLLRDLEDQ